MQPSALFAYAAAACGGMLAFAAAFRARHSLARWAFAVGMVTLTVERVFAGLSLTASSPAEMLRWQVWTLLAMSFLPGTWLLFSLTYTRGPGRPFSPRTRFALAISCLLPVVYFIFRTQAFVSVEQSFFKADALLRLGSGGVGLHVLLLIASIAIVMNLERTFRASVGTIRWRIKFMLLGVGVVFVARIYTGSQILVFRAIDPDLDSINSGALIIGAALIVRSFFRAGHFDLDVYPSQSVLRNSVTVLLAGVYLLIVGLFAKIVTYVGGDGAFALKAFLVLVSLVLLAVVLQSDRARLELRRFVSRHFQRPLYDYRTVWKKFTDATASHVEQPDLCRSLVALVADIFQALSVSIWLLNDKKDKLIFAASTSPRGTGGDLKSQTMDSAGVVNHFQAHPEPADIESVEADWGARLRQCHPGEFANGGNRVCVPMIGRGELLGIIAIGDRVSGAPFSLQDFDLLKCIGDQAAASLMNVQLSQKLLQARELEAFQSMAAFFVHDLKNAASTLNLMLQNLPVHFDNPEFRADALRGISKTVTHINRLIGRLSLLRHELKIELAESDLNEIVTNALAGLENTPGTTLTKDIRPVPRIPLDREQLNKVITNLLLNAAEASPRDGQVRIATAQENGWVVLTVADNGCGMSDEFLTHSLFRPFQTTKKNGLGIGMFQSKMIVEAHGGRIAVASEPGNGTTFQVFLRAGSGSVNTQRGEPRTKLATDSTEGKER